MFNCECCFRRRERKPWDEPILPIPAEDLAKWPWTCPQGPQSTQSPPSCAATTPHAAAAVELEDSGRTVRFYRRVSNGSASARILRPLNNGVFFWELHLGDRMFGTSIMVGVGTERVRTSTATYKNLIGEYKCTGSEGRQAGVFERGE